MDSFESIDLTPCYRGVLSPLTVYETLRLFRSFYRKGRDPEALLKQFALEEK